VYGELPSSKTLRMNLVVELKERFMELSLTILTRSNERIDMWSR